MTTANNQSPRAGQVAQCLERAFRFAFLIQSDSGNEDNKAEQHECFPRLAQEKIDRGAYEQQQKHRLARDASGDTEHPALFCSWKFVWSVTAESLGRLVFRKPSDGI